jgi:D-alanyl-D-alanine carboxypeptidase
MKKLLFLSFIFIFVTMLTACTKTEKTEENQKQNAKYDYLVLVNKQHKLPEDWEANVELVETKNAFDETIKVEKEALKKYNELRDALLEEGVDIELDSAYRSVSRQEELWKEFEEEY